jgi:hypothetical protein
VKEGKHPLLILSAISKKHVNLDQTNLSKQKITKKVKALEKFASSEDFYSILNIRCPSIFYDPIQ